MADVVPLPTAAADPLPRVRWYGPYPRGGAVVPVSKVRNKRKAEAFERRRQAMLAEREESARKVAADLEIERRGVERLRQHLQADGWPFPDIDRSRFDRLTELQKGEVQYHVRRALSLFEQ